MSEQNQSDALTALDVLEIVRRRAQWCREEGDTDMRNILNTVIGVRNLIEQGNTRDQIFAYFDED